MTSAADLLREVLAGDWTDAEWAVSLPSRLAESHWFNRARTALLQAERSEGGSSNPIDDGAVERAYTALKQFYVLDGRVTLGHARAALEAAEPHP